MVIDIEKQKSQNEQLTFTLKKLLKKTLSPVCCVPATVQTVPSLAKSSSQSAHVGKNAMGGDAGRRFGTGIVSLQLCAG